MPENLKLCAAMGPALPAGGRFYEALIYVWGIESMKVEASGTGVRTTCHGEEQEEGRSRGRGGADGR